MGNHLVICLFALLPGCAAAPSPPEGFRLIRHARADPFESLPHGLRAPAGQVSFLSGPLVGRARTLYLVNRTGKWLPLGVNDIMPLVRRQVLTTGGRFVDERVPTGSVLCGNAAMPTTFLPPGHMLRWAAPLPKAGGRATIRYRITTISNLVSPPVAGVYAIAPRRPRAPKQRVCEVSRKSHPTEKNPEWNTERAVSRHRETKRKT